MKLNPMRNQFYIYEILEVIDSHFVKDETGKDRDCPFNEALKQVYSEFQDLKQNWKYPFEEGETYYTIEYSNLHEKYVVEESCWDDQDKARLERALELLTPMETTAARIRGLLA